MNSFACFVFFFLFVLPPPPHSWAPARSCHGGSSCSPTRTRCRCSDPRAGSWTIRWTTTSPPTACCRRTSRSGGPTWAWSSGGSPRFDSWALDSTWTFSARVRDPADQIAVFRAWWSSSFPRLLSVYISTHSSFPVYKSFMTSHSLVVFNLCCNIIYDKTVFIVIIWLLSFRSPASIWFRTIMFKLYRGARQLLCTISVELRLCEPIANTNRIVTIMILYLLYT